MPFLGSMLGVYGEYRISVIVHSAHMIAASLNILWPWVTVGHRLVSRI